MESLFDYPKSLENLTEEKIQNAANTYLDKSNLVQVILIPEKDMQSQGEELMRDRQNTSGSFLP